MRMHESSRRFFCVLNLTGLRKALLIYSDYSDGKYPTPDKWCDLLLEHTDVFENQFKCPGNKKARCSYAINPNNEPNSPPDMVLLFEIEGSWNRWNIFGGPEILTTENHRGKGCHILFNDGRVEFVKPEQLAELNWGEQQQQ